ncbi:nucleotidyl transferase AbiEii/AbiGii toxin family protein [Mycobacterium malmoense]|uniref:nucleotidyl transferase AbiEii/AbiGii toxin family protein n=1 Tax=Mycobacterium malmoense TaxID=1780 RepID=UPI0009F47D42|nr:nucleotidyl transferase AbiEii/AbiGii toxin family protein [Mycobacterium malmoense]QZA18765.1 nucleotidyl transferase AbiEii/AbiGii toxin family protein [Mycobacterium malmoense]UNB95536.1 nucleotidyl transferase AbiEii/AbiGii toxin family protein [Mycobacterium malmoense]
MSEVAALPTFLTLPPQDQRDAYLIASEELNRSATVLEKDVWVCWTLGALFRCPGMPAMAFKGGTSLSKIFNAISRFSEDIDVTMDHNGLAPGLDPYEPKSGKQRGHDDETLRRLMCERSIDVLVPHLRGLMAEVGLSEDMLLTEKDGEVLTVHYPHLVEDRNPYYRESVKIEFGGRNMIEPNETHTVVPYMAATFSNFAFPVCEVSVLSPMRTFWEKVTLAHAESNRPEFRNAERTSRHWHDLAVLAEHEIGRAALLDVELLRDVVRVKERFFRSSTTQYDRCLSGEAKLLPGEAGLSLLRADYQKMLDAEMLDDPLPFDELVERVRALQDAINTVTTT